MSTGWDSISFGSCGLHFFYQIGVANSLLENNITAKRIYCSSGGCPTAIYFLLDLRNEISIEHLISCIPTGADRKAGLFDAWNRYNKAPRGIELARKRYINIIKCVLDRHPDAYKRLCGRMFVYVTAWPWMHSRVISHWNSNEELMDCILATTCIPGVSTRFRAVTYKCNSFVDGGFVAAHPIQNCNTVVVSTQCISQWWSKAYRIRTTKQPDIGRNLNGRGSLKCKRPIFYRALYCAGEKDALKYLNFTILNIKY